MVFRECGCRTYMSDHPNLFVSLVEYCPMHETAPDLVAALKETYGWITTLDINAFGVSYTDDKQRYSIRDKILDDIAKALALAGKESND